MDSQTKPIYSRSVPVALDILQGLGLLPVERASVLGFAIDHDRDIGHLERMLKKMRSVDVENRIEIVVDIKALLDNMYGSEHLDLQRQFLVQRVETLGNRSMRSFLVTTKMSDLKKALKYVQSIAT